MRSRGVAIFLPALIACAAAAAHADSWSPSRPIEVRSENDQWIARTTPAEAKDRPGTLAVRRNEPGAPPRWQATLTNKASPVDIFVSDDGRHVVTLDNWGTAGYGDDVVAFYDADGQRKRYSLEQLLPAADLDGHTSPFLHSVSSRWWRYDAPGLQFLIADRKRTLFAVWYRGDGRWLTWDVASGETVKPDEPLLTRINDRARDWALQNLAGDRALQSEAALRFLGKLRRPDDRKAIERQLAADDFHNGYASNGDRIAYLHAESSLRDIADKLLDAWDGPATQPSDESTRFGAAHGAIIVPAAPPPKAKLFVYLVPADVPFDKWPDAPRPQRLVADFSDWPNYDAEWRRVRQRGRLDIRFATLTPGRYWIKAVFDGAEPHGRPHDENICLPAAGDHHSVEIRLIDVKPGASADFGTLACTTLVRR